MSDPRDEFDRFPFEDAIPVQAAACGLSLSPSAVGALAAHARAVWRHNKRLRLTAISDPREFLIRHLREAFEGASLLDQKVQGTLLDLGSGNGYPGLPVAAARLGLRPVLAEASTKKASFLKAVLSAGGFPGGEVLAKHVQRPSDLSSVGAVEVLVTRAASGWDKIVPRLVPCLAQYGCVLVWAGGDLGKICRRVAWRTLDLRASCTLAGREQSWVWRFDKVEGVVGARVPS